MATVSIIPVRDLKLAALVDLAHERWEIPRLTNPNLKPVSDSIRANAARVRSTMLIPTTISGYVDEVRTWLDQAEFDVTGKSNPPGHNYPADVLAKIHSRFTELHEAHRAQSLQHQGTKVWDELVHKHHTDALHILGPIANNPLGAHGFLAMFSAHITGTWTAIETMCGDLWEAALNCHPAHLASLSGKPTRIAKLNASDSQIVERDSAVESKQVPLNLIQMNNFDIRNKMGTILRTRFEFTRLTTIRQAYSCAFAEKSNRIDTALASKSLDAISAVRNAIVHKAGLADAEYLRRAKYLSIPATKLGSPILLDGDVVANLIRPSIKSASNLMSAVSDWIEQN